MSESLSGSRIDLPDEAEVRCILDSVTAHCDNAAEVNEEKANDGRLWVPLGADNLIMATWHTDAPDLSDIYRTAPKQGEPIEVVARYWYGGLHENINLWLRNSDPEVFDTFNIVVGLDVGSDDVRNWGSNVGRGHGGHDIEPTTDNTRIMLEKMFPEVELPPQTGLADTFSEAIWQQIDMGAKGYTREEFQKAFGLESRTDPSKSIAGGFKCAVYIVNRTHLQGSNSETTIQITRHFWGDDYGGIYDGFAVQSMTIEQDPEGNIVDVYQRVDIRLYDQPYVEEDRLAMISEEPKTNLPDEFAGLTDISRVPSVEKIRWFMRLATEPINEADAYLFGTKS